MFAVRRSIKRFRDDPAWMYRAKAPEYLAGFDRGGYPFSLGPQGNGIHDLLEGVVLGRPVALFHLNAWVRTGGSNRAQVSRHYSAAVLPIPLPLPATALTSGRLSGHTEGWKLPALPSSAGPVQPLAVDSGLRGCSIDPRFGALVVTPEIQRLTREALMGWRIDGDRLVGWSPGRMTYEEMIAMAEALISIVEAFPAMAWEWPAGRA